MSELSLKEQAQTMLEKVLLALARMGETVVDQRLDARDRRMLELRKKGTVTSAEIFAADFGTRNPVGLDVAYPTLENVIIPMTEADYFKKMTEAERKEELSKVDGRGGGNQNIYLHPRFFEAATSLIDYPARNRSNTLSHEHIHRIQGFERDTGWSSAFSATSLMALSAPLRDQDLWGKAKRLYQKFNQAALDATAQAEKKFKVSDYYSKEVEMQARLHEILVQSYAHWQRMPATKVELWAALSRAGLQPPPSISRVLNNTEEGRQALKHFGTHSNPHVWETVNDLHAVQEFLTFDDHKEALWNRVYPHLYGNLLELYGDRLGRERMGLGPNPRPALELLQTIKENPGLDPETFKSLVRNIPAECANELINVSMDRPSTRIKIIDLLLERDDVRVRLHNMPAWNAINGYTSISCLNYAIRNGETTIIEKLLKAGMDPFAEQELIDIFGKKQNFSISAILNIEHLKMNRKILENNPDLPEHIKEWAKNPENKRRLVDGNAQLERGLQAIANHYPDLDKPRNTTGAGAPHKMKTARAMLEEVGITCVSAPTHPAARDSSKPRVA